MLFQILPKFNYRFDPEAMTMFLKTLSGMRSTSNWRRLLEVKEGVHDFQFIIDCDGTGNAKGMIFFYFQVEDEDVASLVANALENMFQERQTYSGSITNWISIRPCTPCIAMMRDPRRRMRRSNLHYSGMIKTFCLSLER